MKKILFSIIILLATATFFCSCKKEKKENDPNTSTSFVKVYIKENLVYETNIVNAYYLSVPVTQLNLTSVKEKNSGGAGSQFIFSTMDFDGQPGTTRITHGSGNSVALQLLEESLVRFDISNKDIDGNRGYLDVTISSMRQSGPAQVITGTFSGKLINDKKTAIEISGSFNDHDYLHYMD